MSDLTEETLTAFLDNFGLTHDPVGTNKLYNQLMALSRYAVLKGLLNTIPELAPLPEPRRIPDAYTTDQVQALFVAVGSLRYSVAGLPAVGFWRALLSLLLDTGLRVSAAFSIRQSNCNLLGRWVFVAAENQKQYADQRLRFTETTRQAISAIWEPPREMLFPWPYDVSTRYNQLDRILRLAGLPLGRRNKFQKCRRTFATWCRRFGADATAQLGHSSDEVTRRYYLDPGESRQLADVMPPRWFENSAIDFSI